MDKKKDLKFLKEMGERLENARHDTLEYEMVQRMIADWISELENLNAQESEEETIIMCSSCTLFGSDPPHCKHPDNAEMVVVPAGCSKGQDKSARESECVWEKAYLELRNACNVVDKEITERMIEKYLKWFKKQEFFFIRPTIRHCKMWLNREENGEN